MLRVEALNVSYGPILAVEQVSFTADPGSVVALLGNNGAGKSSILNAIVGMAPASAGRICLDDREITGWSPTRIVRAGVAMVPEGRHVFPGLTVRENLLMGAYSKRRELDVAAELETIYQQFPRLRERRSQAAGTLSGGEQQMVAIGRALMSRPRLLMLDEPSIGLAPRVVTEVMETVRCIAETGVTVLLVEQNAYQALSLADRAVVLDRGRIAAAGLAKDLLDDETVRRAYIG